MAKYLMRIGIPLVFFGFAFSIIQPEDIVRVFGQTDWTWFCIGCGCVVLGNGLCSLRTRNLLFETSQPLLILWHIHALRALITGALPFSTGELSYVYYLKKYCVTPAAKGFAVLVSVRFLEFSMFLCLLFLLAVVGLSMDASPLNQAAIGIIGINLGLVLVVVVKPALVMTPVTFVLEKFSGRFVQREVVKKIQKKGEDFSKAVKNVFSTDKKTGLMVLTFCIVILRNAFVLSMLRAMGVPISIWFIVYLFVFLFVTRFVQGFGSFGNQEAGISGALMVMGTARADALALAVGTHLLQWIPVLILGGVSYIGIQWSK